MRNFRNWDVWQNSRILVKEIYLVTNGFPNEEKFGMISQLRRAAVSIPTNIAEGAGRNTQKDFRHFLNVAIGSAFEVETLLILSADVELISITQFEELLSSLTVIQKQLNAFITKLN
ncbi:four helix bundle protein [Cyclobacterium xiamenense]|jgi:four helix bundle protein|uniref:four helix bundle protein n=1 Tax=Cyclobacterium xiamenense TaxID=1297121 RepID=UPI0035CE9A24